jgi:transposase
MIMPKGKVYFVLESVDMRGSVNKLCGILVEKFGINPSLGEAYVFFNRGRDKMKALYFDGNGFVILYKRLEECRFQVESLRGLVTVDQRVNRSAYQGQMVFLSDLETTGIFAGLDIKNLKIPKERTYEIF